MRNLLIMCFAALASASAISATVKTATQPWVEAKIADAVKDAGKVQSVNGKTGAVELAAADVGVGLTNGVITIDGERIEPLTSFAESDPHVGLTNGTIYVHGKKVTPLTAHQSLDAYAKTTTLNAYSNELAEAIANATPSDYAAVSNAAMTALQPAATNGLVTASVTNGLASAASVKANADAIATKADATNVYSKADINAKGYLTEHQSLADYAKTATLNAYSNELATAISNATPSDYATVKANASSALSTADANKKSISAINSAGYVTQTTADSSYYPKASGDAWSTYWDGDDVRVTITNFDSTAHLPTLYLEQRTNDTASASSDTNAFRVVWRELTHWDAFLGSTWNWEDATWQGFDEWRASLSSALDEKADRAWGFYDSHTGEYAPDGYTSISSSNVMICAGASYQKTATATCDVWVLTANEPYEATGVSTNGGFQIKDADGNVQVEIVKGDKHTVKAQAGGVSVTNLTLYVVYNVVSSEAPTGEVCLDLSSAQWKAETDSDCPATVTWSGSSGAWVAAVTPTTSTTRCFFKAAYVAGGEDYINNRVPVALTQLVVGGKTYTVGTATIDGNTVLTLTPAN